MGLFGLGLPELAVLAGVTVLVFGELSIQQARASLARCLLLASSVKARAAVGEIHCCFAGPSKLPGLGKELGKTVKSFQSAAKVQCPPFLLLGALWKCFTCCQGGSWGPGASICFGAGCTTC